MAQDIATKGGPSREEATAEMQRALAHYRRIQARLEIEAPNEYATIEADTGEYTVAKDRRSASAAFRSKYGHDRPGWTLYIGTT